MSPDPLDQAITAAIQRAELFAATDRDGDALAILDEALQQTPDHPQLLANRAWILNRLNRGHAALEAANAALSSSPDLIQAQFQRCYALFTTGAHAEAEAAALRGLELDPEHGEFHLLQARLLATKPGRGRHRKQRRDLALAHVETALSLNPEDPDHLARAAEVAWTLGNIDLAEHYVAQGLAVAPEHVHLLTVRADLIAATAQPTSKYDTISQPVAAASEANKLLQIDPQHRGARRTLFSVLWYEQMLLTDGPLALLPIAALNYAICFRSNGTLWSPVPGTIIVLVFAALRLVGYFRITSQANPGYRRMLTHDTRFAAPRRWLTILAWAATLLGTVCALFVRDAVAVRWTLVALALAAAASLAATTLLHLCFPAAAKQAGGFSADAQSLGRLASYRSSLRGRVQLRLLALLGVTILSYAAVAGRDDAAPIALLATAALVISPLAGLLAARKLEHRLSAMLPEGTVLRQETYQRPRRIGAVLLAATLCLTALILLANAARVPLLPNAHDAIGSYTAAPSHGARTECSGRPAARIACIAEKAKDRKERSYDLPRIELHEIEP